MIKQILIPFVPIEEQEQVVKEIEAAYFVADKWKKQ